MYAIPYIAGKCRNVQIIRVILIGWLFFHEWLHIFLLSLHCTLWQVCGYIDCWRCDRTAEFKTTVVAYGRSNKSKTIVKRSIEWNKNSSFKIIERIHHLDIGCIQRLLIGVIPILNRVLKNTLLWNTHVNKIRVQWRLLCQNNSHGFVTWCMS